LKGHINYAIVAAFNRPSRVPSIRVQRICLSLALVCAAPHARAQGICLPPAIVAADRSQLLADPRDIANLPVAAAHEQFEIEAGNVSGGTDGAELTDGIRFRYKDGSVTAERASINAADESIDVIGRVAFENDDFSVFAEDAEFNRETEELRFSAGGFDMPSRPARGSAETLFVSGASGANRLSMTNLNFTTCPADDVDWELLARELELNIDGGFGTARGVKLKFKGVPILYTPYFTFPIDDQRKSGFLTPHIAERDRTGLDITFPYYFNIAPNFDLTLEPRYMSKRGAQVASDFRYLLPRTDGQLSFEYLPDDSLTNTARSYINLQHETSFARNWQLVTGIEEVSDAAYFEDMGDSLSVTSLTHLNRFLDIGYFGQHWSVNTRFHNFQTIDALIPQIDLPYERVPQMLFEGNWGDGVVGFSSATELVNFDRNVGLTGWRFDSTQELSLRFGNAGMYLTPAVALRQTNYWLDEGPGIDDVLTRGVTISSLDTGMKFERKAGKSDGWIQTLEPRLLYVNIPFEDQSLLPIFDTILPDFNLVQLFRKYQFVGPDRIADTNQVSFGLTTRLIQDSTGAERVSATIGQTRYREPQRVTLPGQIPQVLNRSNYVAQLIVDLSAKWSLDLGYQWSDLTNSTERAETRVDYRPQNDRLVGVGYRQRKGLVEQGDLSMVWPIGKSWRVIGQYSYSLLEKKPLEQFFGLEYEACCWRLRMVGRRYIIRSTGQTDRAFSVQLELKGLSQRVTSPEELLDRGILGYRSLGGPAAP
jgi:LPS-assembly protein